MKWKEKEKGWVRGKDVRGTADKFFDIERNLPLVG